MIDTQLPLERFLQNWRFRRAKKHLLGDVLDFGGNRGELGKWVSGAYTVINYDHSALNTQAFDTIMLLAVIEHIDSPQVYDLFHKFKKLLKPYGHIFLTTPTRAAKPVLDFLAWIKLLDPENIQEHKHYWNKKDLYTLAQQTGFKVTKYQRFQFGFNQSILLKHQ